MDNCAIITRMIERRLFKNVITHLEQFPAVALLGPRQVGKTTLAHLIAKQRPSIYLDLEKSSDLTKLQDPYSYLTYNETKLVILDEVQRLPNIFQILRSLIDEGKQKGLKKARFLLLGSASIELIQQKSESLAGRISYLELSPLDVIEIPANDYDKLWLRGGFPDSFLSINNNISFIWRENFIKTYLERDIPLLGPRIPAETLRRFWTMLAHCQGSLLNSAQLARSLAIDGKTVARYLDLFVDLLLVRRLEPFYANVSKRLVKSPKVYLRDPGILHALLQIQNNDDLLSNPIVGASWEGFVIESILNILPSSSQAFFYRTQAGAELDLIISMPKNETWAIEIKKSSSFKLEKGFYSALDVIKPTRTFVVYNGQERYPVGNNIEAIGLQELAKLINNLS